MTSTGKKQRKKAGQIIVFFMMMLFVLLFVVIWIFDLHKQIYVKSVSRNAGDSAALMAGRWQGITLNLIGDLNIINAIALSASNTAASAAVTEIQARLCFVGPMIALMASQQAAKNNGIFPNPDFDRSDSPINLMIPEIRAYLEPPPYTNCWAEYADMLEMISRDGIVAGPDNIHRYSDSSGHILLMIDFYQAITGRAWCWFYHNAPTLLSDYENFFPCWWPPLPPPPPIAHINSEIYGLGLDKNITTLESFTDEATITSLVDERKIDAEHRIGSSVNSTGMTAIAVWYTYGSRWTTWDIMKDPYFPITGTLKPQYDYAGADAAVRVIANSERIMPSGRGHSSTAQIKWTAAAKPFGYLEGEQRPNSYGLVLPAFRAVRLFPIDASSAPSGGSYNIDWHLHTKYHLPEYMAHGPASGSSCTYCQALVTWENKDFRMSGVSWLSTNSWMCTITTPGGGGGHGGGARRGH